MEYRLLSLVVWFCLGFQLISSATDPRDAAALRALQNEWKNLPSSWGKSDDPCGEPWEGVVCSGTRVTSLSLSSFGLEGELIGDIAGLTELTSLDLSSNKGLTGTLSSRIGDLKKLQILLLAGCSFIGSIPNELGNLAELSFLALNSNKFNGQIPPSLGNLTNLILLDLADNKLTGPIPVSTPTSPGLDLLKNAKHFHFYNNQLSGKIEPKLFSSDMVLIHVLFYGNQLSGRIPRTIGLVQTLEIIRFDRNALIGNVPSNLNNLTNVGELNLANNFLSGPLPTLTGMNSLNFVDLSNNSFIPSEAPVWFTTLPLLTSLIIENGPLQGEVPQKLFSLPQIQQVKLMNNAFNDTLDMGHDIGQQLQLVDLQNNQISSVTLGSGYQNTLILAGNPVCRALANTSYCQLKPPNPKPYSTGLEKCGTKSCPPKQNLSPQSCSCAYPYEGTLYFRAPLFRELSNSTLFHTLEMSIWTQLSLSPNSVLIQNPFFNVDDYLQIQLQLFPSPAMYFNKFEIMRLGLAMSNQTYKAPVEFGTYYFIPNPYNFSGKSETIVVYM